MLPAVPAIATVAAISAPAAISTSSAATAAVAASPAAVTTAPRATATGALGLRPRFIDHQISPAEILAVQRIDGTVRIFVTVNFNEREPAGLPGKTIANQIHTRWTDTRLSEPFMDLIFRRGKWKIPNIELLHLPTPFARNPSTSRGARRRESVVHGSPG
jgi:hypothetical protein